MNDLYLIGNGFDLAHGLKTSYNDFLLWYLNSFLKELWTKTYHEDDLMKVQVYGSPYQVPSNFTSIKEVLFWLDEHNYYRQSHHDFFDKILKNSHNYLWVDIEYEYYMSLVEIYRGLEKTNVLRSDFHFSQVKLLNDCFQLIKKKLVDYLLTIKITPTMENRKIESLLLEGTGSEDKLQGEKLFVNFNYTKTMELYTSRNFPANDNLVNIHGELNNHSNPIIFG